MIEKPINYIPRMPVIGDIHGNLDGLVNTVEYMQQASGEHYPFVIQLGDFGYFPEEVRDVRHESELGVHNYLRNQSKRLGFKIIFLRGNHENHDELRKLQEKQKYGLIITNTNQDIIYFPDGRLLSLQVSPALDVTIGVLGGIDKNSRTKTHLRAPFVKLSNEAMNEYLDFKDIDILLTHQGPYPLKKGSSEISALIELLQPKIHLYGHCHEYQETTIGKTRCYGLSKMPHAKRPYLKANDFYGILDLEHTQFILGAQLASIHQAN